MKYLRLVHLAFLLSFFSLCAQQKEAPASATTPAPQEVYFIENKGQWDPGVRYLARIRGMNAWLGDKGIVYDFYRKEAVQKKSPNTLLGRQKDIQGQNHTIEESSWREGHIVRMNFSNARGDVSYVKGNEIPGYFNYFIGNDRSRWASQVHRYESVTMKGIYDGIDARMYFDGGTIRYDMIVAPGADPGNIRFTLEGARNLRIDSRGDLVFTTSLGEIRQGRLFAYQVNAGVRTKIDCKFLLNDKGVGFRIRNYDRNKPLIIDPLIYSTFIGGSAGDVATGMAFDSSGFAYVVGFTGYDAGEDYPSTTGAYRELQRNNTDAFVSKIKPYAGNSLYFSTFYGGRTTNIASDIAVDKAGIIYIGGRTQSDDLPVSSNAYRKTAYPDVATSGDLFVAKIGFLGDRIIYSTYLGGSGTDALGGLALDAQGNCYVGGTTSSTDFSSASNTKSGSEDAFIAKLNPDGSGLVYSRYVGGSSNDGCVGLDIDNNNNVYITGTTESVDFPTTPGALYTTFRRDTTRPPLDPKPPPIWMMYLDAFVYKLKADGSGPGYSTYFGGDSLTYANDIAVDKSGQAHVCGTTHAITMGRNPFPVTPNAFSATINGIAAGSKNFSTKSDGFIFKLNAQGSALVYSTYIGGDNSDYCNAIAVDSAGNAYVTGITASPNFPKKNFVWPQAKFDVTLNNGTDFSNEDAYALRLSPDGSTVSYSSFLGGNANEKGIDIVIDRYWDAYIVGTTNSGGSKAESFPWTRGAYDSSYFGNGNNDLFLARFRMASNFVLDLGKDTLDICAGDSVLVGASAVSSPDASFTYSWKDSSGKIQNITEPTFPKTFVSPKSTMKYFLTATDRTAGLSKADSVVVRVNQRPVSGLKIRSVDICRGRDTVIGALAGGGTGSLSYVWSSSVSNTEIDNRNIATPRVRPVKDTTKYYLTISDGKSCTVTDSVELRVRPALKLSSAAELDFGELAACTADSLREFTLQNTGAGPARIVSVSSDNPSFSFVSAGGSAAQNFTIGRDGSVQIKLRFAPTASGDLSGTIRFVSEPCGESHSISVRGRKLEAYVSAGRTSLNFGTSFTCDTDEKVDSFYIYNKGTGMLQLQDLDPIEPFTAVLAGKSVPQGDSVLVYIRYKASAEGSYQKDLRLPYASGPCASYVAVQLRAEHRKPVLAVDASLQVGTLRGCDSYKDTMIVISNPGTAVVTVTNAVAEPGVKFLSSAQNLRLDPGESRTVQLRFEPVSTGDINAKIRFYFNPCNDSIDVTVTGKKEGINFAVSDTLDFGELILCASSSLKKSFTISNKSATPGARIKSLTMKNGSPAFMTTAAAGDELPAGDRNFEVEFRPGAEANYDADLELVLEPCDIVRTVHLRAAAVQPRLELVTTPGFGSSSGGAVITAKAVFRNSGSAAARINKITGVSAPFAVTSTKPELPAVLASGAELEFELTYTVQAGKQTDTLRIESTEPCALFAETVLEGEGKDMPPGAVKISAGIGGATFSAESGSRILIPLSIISSEGLDDASAIKFTAELRFNKNTLKPLSPVLSNTVAGQERIIRVGGMRMDTAGRMIDIEFLVMLGDSECTDLRLTDIEFTDGTREIVLENARPAAKFCLSDICFANGRRLLATGPAFLLSGGPNPASDETELVFSLPEATHTELLIVDMMGREVLSLLKKDLQPGEHSIRCDVSGLPSGIYTYILRTPSGTLTQFLQVSR